jgi:hypothetical protein
VDFQGISKGIATSQGLSVLHAGRKGTSVLIVQTNLLVDGQITVGASLEVVADLRLEVAVAARMGTENEAVISGD